MMNWKFLEQPLGMGTLSGGFAPKEKHILPALFAAAAAIGSTLLGGAMSANANDKARAQVGAERAATQAERRRRKYESPFDRADGLNVIRMARQEADKIWKREQGAAAVSGSTDAAKQMAKDAGNQMMGNTISNIYASDAERKDAIDADLRRQDRALAQQQIGLDQQAGQIKAQAAAQAASSLMNAAGQFLGASMGSGSPGGGGVTDTGNAGSTLNNMAATPKSTTSTTPAVQYPTPEASTYMQAGQQYNQNYKYMAPNAKLWFNNMMGSIKI